MSALAALVLALAMVETPNGVPAQPGPYGETGRWQLRKSVRDDRAHDLRCRAIRNPTDEHIATEQVLWIKRNLLFLHIDPNDFNVALAWNAGLSRIALGRGPIPSYDFARRVVALAEQNRNQHTPVLAGERNQP